MKLPVVIQFRGFSLFIGIGGYDFTRGGGVIIFSTSNMGGHDFISPFNRGPPFFSFNGSTKCKIRGLFILRFKIFRASRGGSSFFSSFHRGGRHFFLHSIGGVVIFFKNLPKKR